MCISYIHLQGYIIVIIIITEELFQCTEICVTVLIKFINFIILPDFRFYEENTHKH